MRAPAAIVALALCLPMQARGDAPTTQGRQQDLEVGEAAPFKGVLCDQACAADIKAKRVAADKLAEALRLTVQQAEHDRDDAQSRATKAQSRPEWGTLIGVAGAALVIGLAGGVALVYAAKK